MKRTLKGHEGDPVYEDVLAMDPDALDEEWLLHPSHFMEVAESLGEAEAELARVVLDLDRRRAAIDLDVRVMPESYGLTKATNDAASNICAADEEVIALEDRKLSLQTEVNRRQRLLRAMEHRRSALEELSALFRSQYYSEPQAKGGHATSQNVADWRARQKERVIRRHNGAGDTE